MFAEKKRVFAGETAAYFPGGTITFPRRDDIASRRGRYVFPHGTVLVPVQDDNASRRRRQRFPGKTICKRLDTSWEGRYSFPRGTVCEEHIGVGERSDSPARRRPAQDLFPDKTTCPVLADPGLISLPAEDDIGSLDSPDFPEGTICARRFAGGDRNSAAISSRWGSPGQRRHRMRPISSRAGRVFHAASG